MAPVPFVHPVSHLPLAIATSHLASVIYLTYAVGDSLYTSYKSLGPVSSTRSRISYRRRFIPVFLGLTLASFLVALYYFVTAATLSYKTWVHEHGLDLTDRLLSEDNDYIPDSKSSSWVHITQWLSDTPVYRDALEIVAERARRFWWGQQLDLGTAAFSLMLATEGRRRKVPLVTAFLALAYLVSLSFAQCLFFIALLLTPAPLPSGDEDLELPVVPLPALALNRLRHNLTPPKPSSWVPHVMLFYTAMVLNLVSTFMLPYTVGTSAFATMSFLIRASAFLPVILPKITPIQWGTVQRNQHETYASTTKLFRFLSTAAFALHAKTTLAAIFADETSSHHHRHSALLPRDTEKQAHWEKSTNPLGRILASTSDHPAVAAIGWDISICALSLGLWAAMRAINAEDMLSAATPFESKPRTENATIPSHPPRKAENGHGMTLRRRTTRSRAGRGRGMKAKQDDARRLKAREETDDPTFVPTAAVARSAPEGDETPHALDWESASLAWGLAASCGLASASSGVFGGSVLRGDGIGIRSTGIVSSSVSVSVPNPASARLSATKAKQKRNKNS